MIITISGKSGSGKTFIATKLAPKFNAKIISFDEISHQILKNSDILEKIKSYFGETVFENKRLNRKKLGQIVFAEPDKLKYLNSISQIKMEELIDAILSKNQNENFILEYALLPKMKYFLKSDCNILVTADLHQRKTRIIKRDNITEEYFLIREKNAIDYTNLNFDIIIENNDNFDINKLIKQIKEVLCSEKQ